MAKICCKEIVNVSCAHDACDDLLINLGVTNALKCVDVEVYIRGEIWRHDGLETDANGVLAIPASIQIIQMTGKHKIMVYDCDTGELINDTCYTATSIIKYTPCIPTSITQ